ncbi:MAG TPA: MarR family transcriptional regulator [Steroidobacteraceae bacterium]|jgi:DNA-binding MarR family transcriptional regulator
MKPSSPQRRHASGKARPARVMADLDYQRLARFRFMLREFLEFSAQAAKARGLTPPQHQALLVIRALAGGGEVTIADVAHWLMSRHHSAVELVDRLAALGLVRRRASETDRRRVTLVLTPKATRLLDRLSATHLEELRRVSRALQTMLRMLGK